MEQNGFDDGDSNLWDDNVSQGNYWTNWDSDGPYEISGLAESTDRYPSLLSDSDTPVLDHPVDISYDYGTENNTIVWNCTDTYPVMYQIYQDDIRVAEETWYGIIIEFNVDHLPSGTYNFTLRLMDPINIVYDSVIVRVYIDIIADISPELLVAASVLSVVFVVLVLLIVKRIR
jgi:hypothetical protein